MRRDRETDKLDGEDVLRRKRERSPGQSDSDQRLKEGEDNSKGDADRPLSGSSDDQRPLSGSSGPQQPFPAALHTLLCRAEEDGYSNSVTWKSDGTSFVIHDRPKFVSDVLPRYFKQTKFSSFRRQMNVYGFQRVDDMKRDIKEYSHPLFQRDFTGPLESMVRASGSRPSRHASRQLTKPDAAKETSAPYPTATEISQTGAHSGTYSLPPAAADAYGSLQNLYASQVVPMGNSPHQLATSATTMAQNTGLRPWMGHVGAMYAGRSSASHSPFSQPHASMTSLNDASSGPAFPSPGSADQSGRAYSRGLGSFPHSSAPSSTYSSTLPVAQAGSPISRSWHGHTGVPTSSDERNRPIENMQTVELQQAADTPDCEAKSSSSMGTIDAADLTLPENTDHELR